MLDDLRMLLGEEYIVTYTRLIGLDSDDNERHRTLPNNCTVMHPSNSPEPLRAAQALLAAEPDWCDTVTYIVEPNEISSHYLLVVKRMGPNEQMMMELLIHALQGPTH